MPRLGCTCCFCYLQVKGTPAAAAIAQGRASTSAATDANVRVQQMAAAVTSTISAVAADADVANKLVHTYTHAMSGFALSGPTPNQLRALANDPNVVAIWPNRFFTMVSWADGGRLRRNSEGFECS